MNRMQDNDYQAMKQRLVTICEVQAGTISATEAAERLGVSRKTFYEYMDNSPTRRGESGSWRRKRSVWRTSCMRRKPSPSSKAASSPFGIPSWRNAKKKETDELPVIQAISLEKRRNRSIPLKRFILGGQLSVSTFFRYEHWKMMSFSSF